MKKGQVWIETVLYTLIGLAIMGVILSLVKPTLDQKRDQLILGQAIEILNGIDSQIADVIYRGEGNTRTVDVTLRKGVIVINSPNDSIELSMESQHMYSEIGREVKSGRIVIFTKELSKKNYVVSMRMDYKISSNITFSGSEREKTIQESSTPYKIVITNNGRRGGEKTNVDFDIK